MYKRKVRVVFFCASHADYCVIAAGFADRIGRDWIEARAAAVDTGQDPRTLAALRATGIDITERELLPPTDTLLAWADLVVTIGREAAAHCPALPAHVPKKHWAVEPPPGAKAQDIVTQAMLEDIRARLEGILGGLRLMAKSDAGDV